MTWKHIALIALCLTTLVLTLYFAKDALATVVAFLSGIITGFASRPASPTTETTKNENVPPDNDPDNDNGSGV